MAMCDIPSVPLLLLQSKSSPFLSPAQFWLKSRPGKDYQRKKEDLCLLAFVGGKSEEWERQK